MTAHQTLWSLIRAALVLAVVAALYVALAWRAGRRSGRGASLALWLAASALLGAIMIWRTHPHIGETPLSLIAGLPGMFFVGFGCATLSVRRRLHRESGSTITAATIGWGVCAFFTGVAVVLVLFAIADAIQLFGARAA